jgi:hypothetical protein
MKSRFPFAAVGLVAILLTVSCAPAVTAPAAPIISPLETEASIPATAAPADTSAPESTVAVPVATQTVEVQAVATSRGPNLEATDPSTVSLASGQLQLVEFFRFT